MDELINLNENINLLVEFIYEEVDGFQCNSDIDFEGGLDYF